MDEIRQEQIFARIESVTLFEGSYLLNESCLEIQGRKGDCLELD